MSKKIAAYAGDIVQVLDSDEHGTTIYYKDLGFSVYVGNDDIESILTAYLTLATPPEEYQVKAVLHTIHKDHGYQAAAFAYRDVFLRGWEVDHRSLQMVCHEIWRNESMNNEERVWMLGLAGLMQTIHQFCKDYNELA